MNILAIQRIRTELYTRIKPDITTAMTDLRKDLLTLKFDLSGQTCLPAPKWTLPCPQTFCGSTVKFTTWYVAMRSMLRHNGVLIGDDKAQFNYVWSNLKPRVQVMLWPELRDAEHESSWNYHCILDRLRTIYSSQYATQELEKCFDDLCQFRTQCVDTLILVFEQRVDEGNGDCWHDGEKVFLLHAALPPKIRTYLGQQSSIPRGYQDFREMVLQLASQGPSSGRHS